MPIYTFHCSKCGDSVDLYCNYADIPMQTCPSCSGKVVRSGLERPTVGQPSFQSGVTLGSGEKVAGSFKESRSKKGWYRP